jgi:hypothetical protein
VAIAAIYFKMGPCTGAAFQFGREADEPSPPFRFHLSALLSDESPGPEARLPTRAPIIAVRSTRMLDAKSG